MNHPSQARIIVLGEGHTEEGPESFLRPGSPGDPVADDSLGALHILVRRVLEQRCGIEPVIVWPPRIRGGRRTGNPGFLFDLQGRQRRLPEGRPGKIEKKKHPWLSACVGRAAADLAVLVKDACGPDQAEPTRRRIRESVLGVPERLTVLVGAATPSIEGWLLPIDEKERLDEKQAKKRWNEEVGTGSVDSKIARARVVDLEAILDASPAGFAPLVDGIERWAGGHRP